MISTFKQITSFEGDNFNEYLRRLRIYEIFKDIFEEYGDNSICVGIIKFILYAYSVESDLLSVNGNTWNKLSESIFKITGLPDDLHDDVVLLKNNSIQLAIQRFLRLQDDENWVQYITYRDLRGQMLTSALSDIKTANGTEVNYEQKMKNAIHSQTLLEMMSQAKEVFIQNHPKLRESVEAFNKSAEKQKVTRSVGNYAK